MYNILRDLIVYFQMLFRGFATDWPWTGCVGSIEKIMGYPIVFARMLFKGFSTGNIEKILGDPIVYARILFRGFVVVIT